MSNEPQELIEIGIKMAQTIQEFADEIERSSKEKPSDLLELVSEWEEIHANYESVVPGTVDDLDVSKKMQARIHKGSHGTVIELDGDDIAAAIDNWILAKNTSAEVSV